MKKVLFLNGNSQKEFYNIKRNEYEGVYATSIFKYNNTINKIMRRIILKLGINKLEYFFGDWKKKVSEYDLIIISACMYSKEIYKYINDNSKSRVIHWYWNPIAKEIHPEILKKQGGEIWSFDEEDCNKYDLNYIPTYYFKKIKLPNMKEKNDIYFMGADKGRLKELKKLEREFKKQNLSVNFHITKSRESTDKEYNFKEPITYNKVLEGISESKVILDYVQDGQTGLTQRPMESIFFSKKLITNDKNIINYDFYNKDNIFIIDKDNINELYKFVNSDYVSIDKRIIQKYDFGNWIETILNFENY